MKEIGQRLKILRQSMRLTQNQMADILGLKQSSITKYEHGTASPTVEILREYADYFDVSMDYIFARTDNPQGKLYENKLECAANSKEVQRFVEMCFDPVSPFHAGLKQFLVQIMEESRIE